MYRSFPSRYKNFFYYWFPVIIYCALIFIQSSRPVPAGIPDWPYIDKLLHAGAYALLGALFFRAYRTMRLGARLFTATVLSILSAGLYGISDELHQSFVPFRSADIQDALADFIGSAAGAFAAAAAGNLRLSGLTNPKALYTKNISESIRTDREFWRV
ncbi:MAG: VanZ family protein [Thermodesulfobacteriota bacterium]